MAKGSHQRWYEYPGPEDIPDWIKTAGNRYKLSGILLEGDGAIRLVLLPTSEMYNRNYLIPGDKFAMEHMPADLWSELLRRSDDPLVWADDETGTGKAWIRKARWIISGFAQQKTWMRDGLQCLYCGAKMGEALLTIDHFIPLEMGGANDTDNYVTACRRCNKEKGAIDPQEYCREKGLVYDEFVDYLRGLMPWEKFSHLKGAQNART